MRKTVAGILMTLDGVVEAPEKWHLRYYDDEMGEIIDAAATQSDAMLLGRRTYEEFAAFWSSQGVDDPMVVLLGEGPADTVIDVRRFPSSRRSPHLSRDALAGSLPALGCATCSAERPWAGGVAGGPGHRTSRGRIRASGPMQTTWRRPHSRRRWASL